MSDSHAIFSRKNRREPCAQALRPEKREGQKADRRHFLAKMVAASGASLAWPPDSSADTQSRFLLVPPPVRRMSPTGPESALSLPSNRI